MREQRLLDQQKFTEEKQQYLLDNKKLQEVVMLRKEHLSNLQSELHILHKNKQDLETANQQANAKINELTKCAEKLKS